MKFTKYIWSLLCTIIIWSFGISATDLREDVLEGTCEENRYCSTQECFYKWFFKEEQVYQKKKMCVSDSMTLWLSILEKQTLNLSSVFSKGLCNSKVCALRSKSKFAEALLKYRLHKPGCFEIILQWGEHLRGRLMFFVQSIGASRKRDASVKRFFTHWPFFHS